MQWIVTDQLVRDTGKPPGWEVPEHSTAPLKKKPKNAYGRPLHLSTCGDSSTNIKTSWVALLITYPLPAYSTTMHSWLVRQDWSLRLGKPGYFRIQQNPHNFWTNGAILKSFRIKKVLKLCSIVYFMTVCAISYRWGLWQPQGKGGEGRQTQTQINN